MTIPSDLTSQHAKLDANISLIRGRIEEADQEGSAAEEQFDQLKLWTEQVGKMLHGYIHEEQRVLLQQATRVLGEALEEVTEINDHTTELLECFEQFSAALDAVDDRLDDGAFEEVREQFQEFEACFERHGAAERNFYSLYSTILFPAGAATD